MRGRKPATKKENDQGPSAVSDSNLDDDNGPEGTKKLKVDKEAEEDTSLKQRGRPKKNKLKDDAEDISPPKRLRGRPAKTIDSKVDKEDLKDKKTNSEVIVKEENEDENALSKENKDSKKPTRGRPKRESGRYFSEKLPKKNFKGKKSKQDEDAEETKINGTTEKEKQDKNTSKKPIKKVAARKVQDSNAEDESPPKKLKGKQKIKKEEKVNNEKVDGDDKNEKGKKGSKKSTAKKSSKKIPVQEKQGIERSMVKKGAAAVDGSCPIAATSHVFIEGDEIWDCMLNQTNIQFNNNKYYIIQLLRDDNKEAYSVWMRWGRVGLPGQNALKPFAGNLSKAKDTFMKKFSDKTKNEWEAREFFEKVQGKYDLLKMDYSGVDEADNIKKEKDETVDKPRKKVDSKLHAQVKALIELICDVKAMEEAVIEMKYDAKKAPLGKLTVDQVKAGYAALKKIESIILESGKSSNKELVDACNAFYTRIPHYFGMKVPPLIRTRNEIQEKITLLQALGDIQAAMTVINQPLNENMHPVDQHYEGLSCDISALDKNDEKYQLLEKYLMTTHGKTHSMYKMKVLEIFEASKSSEKDRFKDIGNRMLLWHGSRLTNYAGILSQGLRIAPPEAPSTGYMFGKGIYFADMASKSANYCMPSYQNKTGLLVLCDVSLGKYNELINADYDAHKLPKGCHSVKGLGRTAPDSKNSITLDDGVILSMGPGVENKSDYTLQYNEYIVYDVSQVKMKYLFKVEFVFK